MVTKRLYIYRWKYISSIQYTSQSGVLVTENYIYSNGHVSEVNLNGETTVYKLSKENLFGQPTEAVTGGLTRIYGYTPYGLPSRRNTTGFSTTYHDYSYTFDTETYNLLERRDIPRGILETFEYDALNRLITYTTNSASYDIKGNVLSKSDVGVFEYNHAEKPYVVSGAIVTNGIPARDQVITYNSFWRPNTISENGYVATFTYNGNYDRVKMLLTENGNQQLVRYYMGNCYELDETDTTSKEKLYLFGNYYDAAAVYVKDDSKTEVYYLLRDYLGSIMQIVASDGTLQQELSYDAWGRLRSLDRHIAYKSDEEPDLFLGRGFTGHEHLPWFGVINMNARLYDPVTSRFLSPDPYIQIPDFSQSYNRYTYVMNNPFRYVDEDGEFFWVIIGVAAGITVVTNVAVHWKEIKAAGGGWKGFWKGASYFLTGGLAGAAGAAAAAGVAAPVGFSGMLGITATQMAVTSTGFYTGAGIGAASGTASGFVLNAGNSLIAGENIGGALQSGLIGGLSGGIIGGLTGGVTGGIKALKSGRNFWTGEYTNESLVQKAATIAENNVGGKGAVAGTKKHEYATKLLRKYQNINGDRQLYFKEYQRDIITGKKYILDVLDKKNGIIYDWKFGYPNQTPSQLNLTPKMMKYRDLWNYPSKVIKP